MKIKLALLILVSTPLILLGQKKEFDLAALHQSGKLTLVNCQVTSISDQKKGIHLNEKTGQGIAWVNGVTFTNGTIEFDIRGRDVLQKSFVGIAFHAADDATFDVVYFRPFNFHSKDSVRKIHAVQYASMPGYYWKKLRDEKNGVYENGLLNPPDPNGWFHARIEVAGDQVSVFVNDDKKPSLTVTKLTSQHTGKIGFWAGEGSDGDFANLKIIAKK
jgi:hypothetical protein